MFDDALMTALAKEIADRVIEAGGVAPRLLNLKQAATYLGLTEGALRYKALDNQIPCVHLDRKYRFDRQDLDRWIEESKRAA